MRICVIIDAWKPLWGGGQEHVWQISRQLTKKGLSVDIFTRTLIYGDEVGRTGVEVFENGRLRVFRVGPPTVFPNLWGRFSWMWYVVSAVRISHRAASYDLIHAHAYSAAIPGKILQRMLDLPLVFTVHGSLNLDRQQKNLTTFLEKIILTKISYTAEISVTQKFLSYPNVNSSIIVIPNGVDLTEFANLNARPAGKIFSLLWVGRLEEQKGVDVLLLALSKLKKNQNWHLHLVGEGSQKTELGALTKRLKLQKQVTFYGQLTRRQLLGQYAKAHLFVLPSRSEGLPLVILEAWAARIPVVATAVGDLHLLIKEGKTGFLVPPENPDKLAAIISHARAMPNLSQLGNRGYQLVKEKYSWTAAGERTLAVYQKCLAKT